MLQYHCNKISLCPKIYLSLQKNKYMAELRTLLPEEQEIVKKLVNLRQNISENHLSDFHSAKILEQIIDINFVSLVWDKEEKASVKVYYVSDDNKGEAQRTFFKICDYLFLLEELDKAGYITVQDAKSTPRKDNKRYVYNRTKYKQIEEDSEIFFRKADDESGALYLENMNCIIYNIGIVDQLERYINDKLIYPKASLVDYVSNNCRTIERRRYDKQSKQQMTTLIFSIVAIVISIVVPTQCSTKIESKDLQQIAMQKNQKENMSEHNCSTLCTDIVDSL